MRPYTRLLVPDILEVSLGRKWIDYPNLANAQEEKKMDMKLKLSTLWTFATLNYLYCDVISLMDPELLRQYYTGNVNGLAFTPGFLLGAAILIEIPIFYGSPVQSVEAQGEPLGKHCGRYSHDCRTTLDTVYWMASTLLPLPQHS